ncbi:MAG: 4Fe-4S binding protein [Euryarchaeota archaeon]|nr:4Fe-4S binding protein [Euryarchaeota archaeon]
MPHIHRERCTLCGECVELCPTGALELRGTRLGLTAAECVGCGACVPGCPEGAVGITGNTPC